MGLIADPERDFGRLARTQRLMLRGLGVFAALALVGTAVGRWTGHGLPADAPAYTGTANADGDRLYWSLDPVTGEMELARLELHRNQALSAYAEQYRLQPDLAQLIYDVAAQEGIDPDLAFRLVKVESGFNPEALSPVGAVGLAQVMVPTARFYQRSITAKTLYVPETNLRIGFRYLNDLLEKYEGDLDLALSAYNRGPGRVNELLGTGQDPRNGYSNKLTRGYRPAGDGLP